MSEAPSLEPEAARLYQQLAPVSGQDEANGWVTAHLCAVLMAPVELVTRLASADGDKPAWRQILDVDDAPAKGLPWLGQFNGTPLEQGEPEEEQRRKIREARGSHRGTVRAIRSDIQATLTGTKTIDLIERAGDPFTNIVVTLPGETPSETATLAALNDRSTKPLGVMYDLQLTSTWIVAEVEEAYSTSIAALETALETIKDVETHGVI